MKQNKPSNLKNIVRMLMSFVLLLLMALFAFAFIGSIFDKDSGMGQKIFYGLIFAIIGIIYYKSKEKKPSPPAKQPVSKFKGPSPTYEVPPYAEKLIAGTQTTISRLPAYDKVNEPYYNFSLEEKVLIKKVMKVVADTQSFYMLTEDGERVYEVNYADIDKLYHRQRADPVHILRVGGDLKNRIPFPLWASDFHGELVKIIVERAGLVEKKYDQYFRDEVVESTYYSRN